MRPFCLLVVVCLFLISCSKSGSSSAGIPQVKPPVEAATPTGLANARADRALDESEIKSRFFSDGPTEISNLLQGIDDRIDEINTRSAEGNRTCLSNTPVAQSVTVFGETTTAYFQCYDLFGDGTGGMLFGKKDDVWYLFTNVGQEIAFATVSLVSGTTDKYAVQAWMTVGQGNSTSSTCLSSWYGCSYGVIHLSANSATNAFEMTVAGTGFGYCGAHLKSEGTNLFIKGSAGGGTSDGSSWSCSSTDTLCALAADTNSAGDCTNVGEAQFELHSLGVVGHSTYGDNATLDGTTSDSVHFGWTVAQLSQIEGVTAF